MATQGTHIKTSHHIAGIALCLGVFFISPALAAQDIPSSAEPSRVQERFEPRLTPPKVERPKDQPDAPAPAIPDGAANIFFQLNNITIDGMTAYSESDVKSIYSDKLGTEASFADLYRIATELTTRYRNDGYILSKVIVPPQEINNGAVRLRAIEGFVDQVIINNPNRDRTYLIERITQSITQSRPLQSDVLERAMLLINDLPGVTARSVLAPSPDTTGAARVTIDIDEKDDTEGFALMNNRGTRYMGPLQTIAGVTVNSPVGLYESLSLQTMTTPEGWSERELDYTSLSYTQPINGHGTKITLGGSVTSTAPGFTLSEFGVEGLSRSWYIALTHPVKRTRTENINAGLRLDYLNSERRDNISPDKSEDRVRAVRLNADWQFSDSHKGINTLQAEISRGLDIFNAREDFSPNLTRQRGRHEFTKITATATRQQAISDRFEIYAAITGQKSANILLASEEFGVGGQDFGSAYDSSEITGEDGFATRLELRYTNSFAKKWLPRNYQAYTWYDISRVWDRDSSSAKDQERSLASAGIGVRALFNEKISGTLDLALPLTRRVETENDKDIRIFSSLIWQF